MLHGFFTIGKVGEILELSLWKPIRTRSRIKQRNEEGGHLFSNLGNIPKKQWSRMREKVAPRKVVDLP